MGTGLCALCGLIPLNVYEDILADSAVDKFLIFIFFLERQHVNIYF